MVKVKTLYHLGFAKYEATIDGHIYSYRCHRKKWLKPDKRGYVSLMRYRMRYTRHVGMLVLTAFVGSRPPTHKLRHIDGDLCNNRLSNLCWTRKRGMRR